MSRINKPFSSIMKSELMLKYVLLISQFFRVCAECCITLCEMYTLFYIRVNYIKLTLELVCLISVKCTKEIFVLV